VRVKQYFYLLLVPLLVCCYGSARAQNVQVESKLDKASMPIGAQTVLHVAAHIPAKSAITFPQLRDSIGKIKIVKGLKPDTAFDKNNPASETITHNYAITCFDTGHYVIPELELHTATGTFKTGKVNLKITAVPVDTTKTFYDIKQPFVVHYTFWDWLRDHWIWVVLVAVILLAVPGLIYFLRKRPEVIIKKAPVVSTLEDITLNKLYALRDKKLWQQNVKLYHTELVDILHKYLEKRYGIHTEEKTTAEILSSLQEKTMTDSAGNLLAQILKLADLVKFAKENPSPDENEQQMDAAIDFIGQAKEESPV
jgi:hypothetical protein